MHGYGCMGIKIDLHIDSAGKEKQVKVREAVIIYSAAAGSLWETSVLESISYQDT